MAGHACLPSQTYARTPTRERSSRARQSGCARAKTAAEGRLPPGISSSDRGALAASTQQPAPFPPERRARGATAEKHHRGRALLKTGERRVRHHPGASSSPCEACPPARSVRSERGGEGPCLRDAAHRPLRPVGRGKAGVPLPALYGCRTEGVLPFCCKLRPNDTGPQQPRVPRLSPTVLSCSPALLAEAQRPRGHSAHWIAINVIN